MNNAQKVIKYVAIAVAIALIVSIVSGIATTFVALTGISSLIEIANGSTETMNYTMEYVDIHSIEIDVSTLDLEIVSSDKIKVQGTSLPTDYKFKQEEGILKIQNKKVNKDAKLVVYLPNNINELDIEIGAGKIKLENIIANELNLDTGAATAEISNLTVTSKAEVDMGIGDTSFENVDTTNLDMDAGVGNVEYNGYLRGMSEIDCGVGNIDLYLKGTEAMYKVIAEKGIGEIKINDVKLSGMQTVGTGINTVKLSGGIGNLKVSY